MLVTEPATIGTTIAVMQPYLYPYAGYYRLLACSDVFVIFDDVQFQRRGRIHRCEMPHTSSKRRWLTLPLARQPRNTPIADLAFAEDARASFDKRLAAWPWIAEGRGDVAGQVRDHLYGPLDDVASFLEEGLRLVAGILDLRARIVRSSTVAVGPHLRGQDRIIAIVQALGGHNYINAPGGRALYSGGAFERAGLNLQFLPDYTGPYRYVLPALMRGRITDLRQDVIATRLSASR